MECFLVCFGSLGHTAHNAWVHVVCVCVLCNFIRGTLFVKNCYASVSFDFLYFSHLISSQCRLKKLLVHHMGGMSNQLLFEFI